MVGKETATPLLALLILAATLLAPAGGAWSQEDVIPVPPGQVCIRVPGPFKSICDVLPKTYAQVIGFPVPVYGTIHSFPLVEPKRWLRRGFVWVSLESNTILQAGGHRWLLINPGEFVELEHLRFQLPSMFRGVELKGLDGPFLWLILDTTPSRRPGGPPDYRAEDLRRYARYRILETRMVKGWNWYKVGKETWIEQRRAAVIRRRPRPKGVGPHDKWIDVSLYEQTLMAYEGDRPVYATLISSGVRRFPTVEGLFRIWLKVRMAKMSGAQGKSDYYYLEDIPWQMYFRQGYAIHTSYWHDWFGFPQSHGCINVSPYDAWWLFRWTSPHLGPGDSRKRATRKEPGTWVYVHP